MKRFVGYAQQWAASPSSSPSPHLHGKQSVVGLEFGSLTKASARQPKEPDHTQARAQQRPLEHPQTVMGIHFVRPAPVATA